MLKQFLNHIETFSLISPGEKVLLAVSGGIDSMVMLDLFLKGGFTIGVAHCNFKLRPSEADAEEELVRETCHKNGIEFHLSAFDTRKFALDNGLSTQVAARNLRYEFFDRVLREGNYQRIATAHHQNDSLETVLINLVRGTGLEGLGGIPVKNGNTIRPMLFATRDQIRNYATAEGIVWREDSSNSSDDYSRNLLRNKVIPLLKEINPGLEDTFTHTVARIRESKTLLDSVIETFKSRAVREENNQILILRNELFNSPAPVLLLWEVIKEHGFRYDQVMKMVEVSQAGKVFYSPSHVLLNDRENFVLQKQSEGDFSGCLISENELSKISEAGSLTLERTQSLPVNFSKENSVAFLDAERLVFPLVWRPWRDGDHFYPLGMNQRKKISDFLIDQKVDLLKKRLVTVVESDGEIVWVVGHRISEKVKVTAVTKQVLRITLVT